MNATFFLGMAVLLMIASVPAASAKDAQYTCLRGTTYCWCISTNTPDCEDTETDDHLCQVAVSTDSLYWYGILCVFPTHVSA
jgi:hypothetical protein